MGERCFLVSCNSIAAKFSAWQGDHGLTGTARLGFPLLEKARKGEILPENAGSRAD
jgi:hypothetical protein